MNRHLLAVVLFILSLVEVTRADEPAPPPAEQVKFQWGVKIPLRDGVKLNATVYTPKQQKTPAPCIFTLTPYISQSYHDRGIYFAAHGYPFLTVDVRGRGNSEGEFRPLIQEARDGHDVVEWLAQQPYCNGKVTMWGGSYAGYNQWATAKEFPPHLTTIVPVASPYAGADFPMRANISSTYLMQWLTFTSGHASQDRIFADDAFWRAVNGAWFESGAPYKQLDTLLGNPSRTFQEWLAHPQVDDYWDSYNPTADQYAKLSLPILTITGSYDGDQPGALEHYRNHIKNATPEGRARHFLVIGPWDHAGTRTPQAQFGGLTFGQASLVDLPQLHLDWYAWTLQGGPQPKFLQKRVAYYVMDADRWRYADTLEAVTAESRSYFLDSIGNATDALASGSLGSAQPKGKPDQYIYDPRDVSIATVERTVDPASLTDQRMVHAQRGKALVYHSAPFERDTEISGFFKLSAWLAIDQPDTDFAVSVYEIRPDASSVLLSTDQQRARYREGLRQSKLVTTREPLKYDFGGFMFTSRMIRKGSRLRLVIGPMNSMSSQKNYNSGGDVSSESMRDARTVTVNLYHDRTRPSTLFVPIGQP
ncbi:MAG: CocE/NonD family hydrolase [Steroidobacter sp.]